VGVAADARRAAARGERPLTTWPHPFFGVATAAYQIEGAVGEDGRGESIWDRFSHTPGATARGETGDVACDHYHRWAGDLDLMAGLGIESYRFSIAWPRVQPDGRGAVNAKGLEWYRRLAEGLRERGIEPVATLYHWDLPQALQEDGGWAARDTTERFAEYASATAAALGDVVAGWITHNEPNVAAFVGHAEGRHAPGVRDWATALRVSHHLLLSHGLAVGALRAALPPGAPVGITLNLHPAYPADDTDADRAATTLADGHQNRWFLDPVFRGRYPQDMLDHYARTLGPPDSVRDGDLAAIAQRLESRRRGRAALGSPARGPGQTGERSEPLGRACPYRSPSAPSGSRFRRANRTRVGRVRRTGPALARILQGVGVSSDSACTRCSRRDERGNLHVTRGRPSAPYSSELAYTTSTPSARPSASSTSWTAPRRYR
jgi:hypothetical protein